MKRLVTAATIAAPIVALLAFPMAAEAKHKKNHKGMEGPPNAAGYTGKGDAGGKSGAAGGEKMKGPPNADGYGKN